MFYVTFSYRNNQATRKTTLIPLHRRASCRRVPTRRRIVSPPRLGIPQGTLVTIMHLVRSSRNLALKPNLSRVLSVSSHHRTVIAGTMVLPHRLGVRPPPQRRPKSCYLTVFLTRTYPAVFLDHLGMLRLLNLWPSHHFSMTLRIVKVTIAYLQHPLWDHLWRPRSHQVSETH